MPSDTAIINDYTAVILADKDMSDLQRGDAAYEWMEMALYDEAYTEIHRDYFKHFENKVKTKNEELVILKKAEHHLNNSRMLDEAM